MGHTLWSWPSASASSSLFLCSGWAPFWGRLQKRQRHSVDVKWPVRRGGASNRCTIPGANELGVCLLCSFRSSSGNKTTRLQRQSVCDALHSKAQKFINHSYLFNVHCSRNTEFCGTYYCLENMKCCILPSQSKFISTVIKSQS